MATQREVQAIIVAIVGAGCAGALAACCLAECLPRARIEFFCRDNPNGHELEPVVLDAVPPLLRSTVDEVVVHEWNSFIVVCDGKQTRHSARIALIDPMQIALQLDRHGDRITVRTDSAHALQEGLNVLDLTSLSDRAGAGMLMASKDLAELSCPVLGDFDVSRPSGVALQYFPVASGRVLTRQFPINASMASVGEFGVNTGTALATAMLAASGNTNAAISRVHEYVLKHDPCAGPSPARLGP